MNQTEDVYLSLPTRCSEHKASPRSDTVIHGCRGAEEGMGSEPDSWCLCMTVSASFLKFHGNVRDMLHA